MQLEIHIMTTHQDTSTERDLVARMRSLEVDHEPDGWPAVRMKEVSALCYEIERLRAALASRDEAAQQPQGQAVSDEQIVEALESAGVKFQRFMGGIGGTKDIWSTSGAQSVKNIAAGVRAILALKATASKEQP